METAKLFWTGRSQAVRLPKSFRFEGAEVRIRRQGDAVILEPVATDWRWLDAVAGQWEAEAPEKPAPQERPGLDDLFR
jgi:antitoxin VapB